MTRQDLADEIELDWHRRCVTRRGRNLGPPEPLGLGPRYQVRDLADRMGLTPSQAAQRLGISGRDVHRGLSETQADRFAVLAGMHPLEVWPEWGIEEEGAA